MPVANSKPRELLPADALKGKSLGISVSESADLGRLGLVEEHFRLAIGELGRSVLISGGELYYGGNLRPDGYTTFLMNELHRYGGRNFPLKVCLAWSEHQKVSDKELDASRKSLGLVGEIILLDIDGTPLPRDFRKSRANKRMSKANKEKSLSSLRTYIASQTDARMFIGGKRTGFEGKMPGIFEEALKSIELRKPAFLAGGFGGATLDLIRVLKPDYAAWFPDLAGAEELDDRYSKTLRKICQTVKKSGWSFGLNGLTEEENAQLSATYRPSEIAALVSLGLGRTLAN